MNDLVFFEQMHHFSSYIVPSPIVQNVLVNQNNDSSIGTQSRANSIELIL